METTGDPRYAAALTVPEGFLDALAVRGIGEGVQAPSVRHTFSMPMIGTMEVSIHATIIGTSFALKPENEGRLHATITALGDIEWHDQTDEEGAISDTEEPIRVVGEVLVRPTGVHGPGRSFTAGLDVDGAELLSLRIEDTSRDQIDEDVARAHAQMNEMVLATMGEDLFELLKAKMDDVSVTVEGPVAEVLGELGIDEGHADIEVCDGYLLVCLTTTDDIGGGAMAVPAAGTSVGVGIATAGLAGLVSRLGEQAIGDVPLPFDLDLDFDHERIAGRVRNARLFSDRVPDLRSGLRYTVRPSLVNGHLEMRLEEAWLDLPAAFPQGLNRLNRRIGALVGRFPLTFRLPTSATVPVRPDSEDTMTLTLRELRLSETSVGAVVDTDL
ncbi:MAG: hypothetical protein EDR02_03715 [Actinobacteria bacterium]|nr:MAG: hypothetical protein EDR02_03715 [Actinomycetota bacterium]RIK06177.1 MAG: hypothetical protein DCC48_07025 [Acidobacteriota bacterium]